jgi:exosortase A-associated hydrolase 1
MPAPSHSNKETPTLFQCKSNNLFGIFHHTNSNPSLGVLIIVGGPQYRVGSHRQFVLLARFLASNGFPVLRFDYGGMGDSEGNPQTFSTIDDDIASAIENLYDLCPEISGVVLWGLCDAASAALFYGYQDDRVKGLVLLNPWVFSEQGAAKTHIKHYYLQRLMSPDFWKKILNFQFNYTQSLSSLASTLQKIIKKDDTGRKSTQVIKEHSTEAPNTNLKNDLPTFMQQCLQSFKSPILLILSGNDLTADEFRDLVKSDRKWAELLNESRVTTKTLNEADHTFSNAIWREQVSNWTSDWLKQLQN